MNKLSRQCYASVLDMLTGMAKTDEWRDYMTEGADPMEKEVVRAIFLADVTVQKSVKGASGRTETKIDLEMLRNRLANKCRSIRRWPS